MLQSNCLSREQLICYSLGALEEDAAESLEEHLQTCSACESLFNEYERVANDVIAAFRAIPVEPISDFDESQWQAAISAPPVASS